MAKKAKEASDRPAPGQAKGRAGERLTNKTEAVRRALKELGPDAKPLEIQAFVKDRFGVEISTKVVSIYKAKLGRRGRRRGKPKGEVAPAAPAPRTVGHREVTIADLRAMRELSDRVGTRRLRELLELLSK
jgi:hypothetical protein